MVLLVFAGSAAEFAVNRAVDWLFFTGKVPSDPIGRLFATASHAQQIVFTDELTASRTLDGIRAVHEAIERQRGQRIPDWAHRDVLYMLIDYSEKAHELLAHPLSADEQRELYDVFYRVGTGLRITGLPPSYTEWRADRECHLRGDLRYGDGTEALYAQYRDHLGAWRYRLLLRIQALLAPEHVRGLLRLKSAEWLRPLLRVYPILVRAGLHPIIQRLLMPSRYLAAVRGLDHLAPRPALSRWRTSFSIQRMRQVITALALLAVGSRVAAAQFPDRVQPGVRVRVWLPEPQPQENTPWRRQLLRATVSAVENDVLRLTVPGTQGTLAVQRGTIRRLDVSRGRSRAASAVERAIGFAIAGAITAALSNDPEGNKWPAYRRDWRAAEEGAKWGGAIGAVVGFAFPTERWRRVKIGS
jgi:hypothetical protein